MITKLKAGILIVLIMLSFVACGLSDPALDSTLQQDEQRTREILKWRLDQ